MVDFVIVVNPDDPEGWITQRFQQCCLVVLVASHDSTLAHMGDACTFRDGAIHSLVSHLMDSYTDTYAKVALSVTAAQKAKESLVEEMGVGEDLPFNFFGWRGDRLSMVVQCSKQDMLMPVAQRFDKCIVAIQAMCDYWQCDSVTMVAEGFQAKVPEMLQGEMLAKAFAKNDPGVEETLVATHIELNRFAESMATLVSVPYQYLLGRHIVWDDALGFERGIGDILTGAQIPSRIADCLQRRSLEPVTSADLDEMMDVMLANGFSVQEFE